MKRDIISARRIFSFSGLDHGERFDAVHTNAFLFSLFGGSFFCSLFLSGREMWEGGRWGRGERALTLEAHTWFSLCLLEEGGANQDTYRLAREHGRVEVGRG